MLYRTIGDVARCEQILRNVVTNYPDYMPAQEDLNTLLTALSASHRNGSVPLPKLEIVPKASGPGESRTPDWNQSPDFGRRDTLLRTLQRLNQLYSGPVCIVETGTARDERPQARTGDGWSTIAWGWYASEVGGRVVTIDINPEAIAACRRLTAPYAEAIDYIETDSLAFLQQWQQQVHGPIHLLYLDSLDYVDQERSEAHNLAEAQIALPSLAPLCLVLFDDTNPTGGRNADGSPVFTGKGARAIPFLLEQGFRLEWCASEQALLSRGTEPMPPYA